MGEENEHEWCDDNLEKLSELSDGSGTGNVGSTIALRMSRRTLYHVERRK